jgi:hypothetical protein
MPHRVPDLPNGVILLIFQVRRPFCASPDKTQHGLQYCTDTCKMHTSKPLAYNF